MRSIPEAPRRTSPGKTASRERIGSTGEQYERCSPTTRGRDLVGRAVHKFRWRCAERGRFSAPHEAWSIAWADRSGRARLAGPVARKRPRPRRPPIRPSRDTEALDPWSAPRRAACCHAWAMGRARSELEQVLRPLPDPAARLERRLGNRAGLEPSSPSEARREGFRRLEKVAGRWASTGDEQLLGPGSCQACPLHGRADRLGHGPTHRPRRRPLHSTGDPGPGYIGPAPRRGRCRAEAQGARGERSVRRLCGGTAGRAPARASP